MSVMVMLADWSGETVHAVQAAQAQGYFGRGGIGTAQTQVQRQQRGGQL